MSPFLLAARTVLRQPARSALGILGIVAIGALLLDMLLLSQGLVVSFGELLDSVGYDVRVTATRAMPTLGPRVESAGTLADRIRALPEVDLVTPLRFGYAYVERDEGRPSRLWIVGIDSDARGTWRLLEGEEFEDRTDAVPDGAAISSPALEPPPLLINERLAGGFGVGPGDTLRLRSGGERSTIPAVTFRVTGIADFAFETAIENAAATTRAGTALLYGEITVDASADVLMIDSADGVTPERTVAAIRAVEPSVHAFSNEQMLERLQGQDFAYFRQISFVLSTVTLFFAFLLVTTLLTVTTNQRYAEIASLRALGFSRRRVAADLLWQSAFLVGAGGLLALPAGLLLARVLDSILKGIGTPERLSFFVLEPRALGLYALLLVVASVLAAVYPISLAVRLPIAATLRKEVVS